jgi:NAD(P)H-hydrate epimerase
VIFEPLFTAAEMRRAEERYPGYPGTAPELMERAGRAVAVELLRRYPGAHRVAVVCGGGANGGDGRIAAAALRDAGVDAVETDEPAGFDVVVDALFGTGFAGAPRDEAAAAIERINSSGAAVVAVDIPSGVDASTGEVPGASVRADLTVTFHARKVGHAVAPGRHVAGAVVVADIGLEPAQTAIRRVREEIVGTVPTRGARDTKYTAGAVVVVGGAPGMTGAAVLTARAALRADAGYVTLCVPAASLPVVETLALEPVKLGLVPGQELETILAAAARARAVAVGPGLGRDEATAALVRALLERLDVPVVVDADALFGLEPVARSAATILTPHAGELGRLLGRDSVWVDAHRLASVEEAVERYGAVVLLKGADTLVGGAGTGVLVADHGPPSLATAGTGDVLTGIVAAFLARGLEPVHAAAAAATVHALAARRADLGAGLIASDVVEAIPAALAAGGPPPAG